MKRVFIVLLVIFIQSCRTVYQYESTGYSGKSYLGKYEVIETTARDSVTVSGMVLAKHKNSLGTLYGKIYLIDKQNDTILRVKSDLFGYNFNIPPGRYKIVIASENCNLLQLDSILLESGKYYHLDYYLQKGSGNDKWYLSY